MKRFVFALALILVLSSIAEATPVVVAVAPRRPLRRPRVAFVVPVRPVAPAVLVVPAVAPGTFLGFDALGRPVFAR